MSEPDNEQQKKSPPPPPKTEARMVIVQSNPKLRIGQEITIGPHRLTADEPDPVGEDTGPTGHELLTAALGACTAMTLTLYANRKEWPLESVSVVLKHHKIDAADCEGCEGREGKIDHFERAIQLGGPLNDEQRSRLLEIADRCPVSRTLRSEVHIESRLV